MNFLRDGIFQREGPLFTYWYVTLLVLGVLLGAFLAPDTLPDSVFVRLGPLTIYWYGVLMVTGILVGAYHAAREARRNGENPDHIWNAILVVAGLGLIGARLYHIFSSPQGTNIGWDYYRQHPAEILYVWQGGLGIYGAVAGGFLGAWLYARVYKLHLAKWLDFVAPSMFLGQAIGRWGNFFNQELYGYPATMPWGIQISADNRLPQFSIDQYPETTRFHPTFLYESLWNLGGFFLLSYIWRRYEGRLMKGDLFLLWAMLYGFGRFLVEFQRPDAWLVGGIPTAQIIGLGLLAFGGTLLFLRHRRRPEIAATGAS
ncbi:MAG: prolipoprotein diacylglyceryl transferase [Chloroflexi bacterium]|nr:prolipoprotein diacylglyceryl transferase [Chloroflexota bacterium]